MFAEPRPAGRDLVLGVRQVGAEAQRLVFGGARPPERQIHAPQRGLPLDEAEGLRNGQLEGQAQQLVEHARARLSRVILDRHQPQKAARRMTGGAKLDRLLRSEEHTSELPSLMRTSYAV